MNLAPVIIGAVLGALSAGPAPAGGVLLCDPYGCRSSPYWPPVPVPVRPPVAFLPPGPGPEVYAPPPGLRPSYAPPQRRTEALPDPPPSPQADPPPRSPRPPSRQEAAQQADIEASIEAFCDGHPDEQFCGKLGTWLRAHPNNRR